MGEELTCERDGVCSVCGERPCAALREENARLTRERDEAREKLAALEVDYAEAQDIAVSESAGRRAAEAEVARLEGLK